MKKSNEESIINLLDEFQKYWDTTGTSAAEWRIRKHELASIVKEVIHLLGDEDVSLVQEYANTPDQKKAAERMIVFYKGNKALIS